MKDTGLIFLLSDQFNSYLKLIIFLNIIAALKYMTYKRW